MTILDVNREIFSICKKAGIQPKQVYEVVFTPRDLTFSLYDLKNGKPYYDRTAHTIARLPRRTFKIRNPQLSIWETPCQDLPWRYRWFMQPLVMLLKAVNKLWR
jgi:hypothetical protein